MCPFIPILSGILDRFWKKYLQARKAVRDGSVYTLITAVVASQANMFVLQSIVAFWRKFVLPVAHPCQLSRGRSASYTKNEINWRIRERRESCIDLGFKCFRDKSEETHLRCSSKAPEHVLLAKKWHRWSTSCFLRKSSQKFFWIILVLLIATVFSPQRSKFVTKKRWSRPLSVGTIEPVVLLTKPRGIFQEKIKTLQIWFISVLWLKGTNVRTDKQTNREQTWGTIP